MTVQENIASRKAAEEMMVVGEMLVDERPLLEPVFWAHVAQLALERGGKPRKEETKVSPMDDSEAIRYGRRTLGFGKNADKPIAEIELDYLDWLLSQRQEWTDALSRYLSSAYVQRQRDQLDGRHED